MSVRTVGLAVAAFLFLPVGAVTWLLVDLDGLAAGWWWLWAWAAVVWGLGALVIAAELTT